ncbi:MAG: hypothetical protein J5J06_10375 [Phycisphaerae bacterium]|nr:hypothetical protein [Phycisphaerae bacterium]
MTREEFEHRLQEIAAVIEELPEGERERLRGLLAETRRRYLDTNEALDRARTALDDWRIMAKYRLFDFEASLREANSGRIRPKDDEETDPQS